MDESTQGDYHGARMSGRFAAVAKPVRGDSVIDYDKIEKEQQIQHVCNLVLCLVCLFVSRSDLPR